MAHCAALTLAMRSFASSDPFGGPVYLRGFRSNFSGISASGVQSVRIFGGITRSLHQKKSDHWVSLASVVYTANVAHPAFALVTDALFTAFSLAVGALRVPRRRVSFLKREH